MLGNFIGTFRNNPFLQDAEILKRDLGNLIKIVEGNEADEMILLLREAFEYFMQNPEDYDGATGDEESGAAKKYDIPSIIHDYFSIIGLDYKYTIMRLSDKLFVLHMKALNYNSLQIAKRKIGLYIISIPRWLRQVFKATFDREYKNFIAQVDYQSWRKKIELEILLLPN